MKTNIKENAASYPEPDAATKIKMKSLSSQLNQHSSSGAFFFRVYSPCNTTFSKQLKIRNRKEKEHCSDCLYTYFVPLTNSRANSDTSSNALTTKLRKRQAILSNPCFQGALSVPAISLRVSAKNVTVLKCRIPAVLLSSDLIFQRLQVDSK